MVDKTATDKVYAGAGGLLFTNVASFQFSSQALTWLKHAKPLPRKNRADYPLAPAPSLSH